MSTATDSPRRRRHLARATAGFLAVALLAACSGSSSDDGGGTSALTKRLTAAQQHITDADALTISMSTPSLPDGTTGLTNAKGRGYQGEIAAGAAFEGNVDVVSGGSTIKAEVIAVDGKVWAKTSLVPDVYLTIDPQALHAPDPASLLGAKGDGLPIILVKTEGLKDGGKSRDGKDVLTTITGTLPGAVVHQFLPSADPAKSFSVTYRLTDDDVLHDARIKGPFYPGSPAVTYDVKLTANTDNSLIKAPTKTGR